VIAKFAPSPRARKLFGKVVTNYYDESWYHLYPVIVFGYLRILSKDSRVLRSVPVALQVYEGGYIRTILSITWSDSDEAILHEVRLSMADYMYVGDLPLGKISIDVGKEDPLLIKIKGRPLYRDYFLKKWPPVRDRRG
jgi:hypothetical protein